MYLCKWQPGFSAGVVQYIYHTPSKRTEAPNNKFTTHVIFSSLVSFYATFEIFLVTSYVLQRLGYQHFLLATIQDEI
jgi:hypothetical protein